jgi:hypothetical protein
MNDHNVIFFQVWSVNKARPSAFMRLWYYLCLITCIRCTLSSPTQPSAPPLPPKPSVLFTHAPLYHFTVPFGVSNAIKCNSLESRLLNGSSFHPNLTYSEPSPDMCELIATSGLYGYNESFYFGFPFNTSYLNTTGCAFGVSVAPSLESFIYYPSLSGERGCEAGLTCVCIRTDLQPPSPPPRPPIPLT